MVAIIDDVLELLIPSGLMDYAGLILSVFVGYKIIDFVRTSVAKK